MSYRLREGVTFCLTSERYVFLDLVRDRYFCLAPTAERAFAQLVEGSTSGDERSLQSLIRDGLLVEDKHCSSPEPSALLIPPTRSLLDDPHPPVRRRTVGEALAARLASSFALKVAGLERVLRRTGRRPHQSQSSGTVPSSAGLVAAALSSSSLIVASRNQCLCMSLAAARMLRARRVPSLLVLGVKLRPFQAHCWVQVGDAIVTDRLDVVRNFTPIRVV